MPGRFVFGSLPASRMRACTTSRSAPPRPPTFPPSPRIYAHAVEHGTASFELEPPDEAEMARRMRDAARRRLSLSRRRDRRRASPAMPMPAPIARGRPIASPSRIRSTSRRDMQRRGVGRALLDRADRRMREQRGFRQMIAVIGDSRSRRRRSRCTAPPAFAWSARSRMSASSSAAGSTRVLMQRALGRRRTTTDAVAITV